MKKGKICFLLLILSAEPSSFQLVARTICQSIPRRLRVVFSRACSESACSESSERRPGGPVRREPRPGDTAATGHRTSGVRRAARTGGGSQSLRVGLAQPPPGTEAPLAPRRRQRSCPSPGARRYRRCPSDAIDSNRFDITDTVDVVPRGDRAGCERGLETPSPQARGGGAFDATGGAIGLKSSAAGRAPRPPLVRPPARPWSRYTT